MGTCSRSRVNYPRPLQVPEIQPVRVQEDVVKNDKICFFFTTIAFVRFFKIFIAG